jgi:hypothetical protein
VDEIRPEGAFAALGAAVAPPEVMYAGKPWKIGHPTQEAKAELEKLVVQVAEQSLADLRGALSAVRYAALEQQLDDRIYARHWQTWGSLWQEVCNGPLSFPLFLLSLMKPHHPTATIADAQALWLNANRPCRHAIAMVLPDFFDLLAASLPADASERREQGQKMAAELLARLQHATLTASDSTAS